MELASRISLESVIRITGMVVLRPLKQRREDTRSGSIEIVVEELELLSQATDLRLPSYKEFGKVCPSRVQYFIIYDPKIY